MMAVREQTGFNILEFPAPQLSKASHFNFICIANNIYKGLNFLIDKLLKKIVNQNNKIFSNISSLI